MHRAASMDALARIVSGSGDQSQVLEAARSVRGELAERMGIELTELTAEKITASMPVPGNRQPFGLLHGGASAVLAETLGSFHAQLLAGAGRTAVGTELSCTHHRSVSEGEVFGTSIPLHTGRTMMTFEIVINDDAGRRVCTARLSCVLRQLG